MKKKGIFKGFLLPFLTIFLLCDPVPSFTNDGDQPIFDNPERLMVRMVNDLSDFEYLYPAETQIQNFINRNRIKGATVAIMRHGRLVYAKGFGYANEELNEEVQPYHNFRIASASKWVTALGIMKLYQDGILKLDDPVFGENGWLGNEPFTEVIKDPAYQRVQVKHLLYHTTGWNTSSMGDPMFKPNHFAGRIKTEGEITQDDIFRYAVYYKLPHRPGTHYSYSNVGYAMLGRIISIASGRTYEDYIRQEILKPLGIVDMFLTSSDPEKRMPTEVVHYDHQPNTIRQAANGSEGHFSRIYQGTHFEALEGAGSWAASAADLLRLLAAADGDPTVKDFLRKDVIDLMLEPTNPGNSFIGWKDVKDQKWIRTGTLIGTNALLVRYSDEISYCIITNTSTWKGASTNTEMQYLMDRVVNMIEEWPDHNLFGFYELPPLQAISPKGFKEIGFQTF